MHVGYICVGHVAIYVAIVYAYQALRIVTENDEYLS